VNDVLAAIMGYPGEGGNVGSVRDRFGDPAASFNGIDSVIPKSAMLIFQGRAEYNMLTVPSAS